MSEFNDPQAFPAAPQFPAVASPQRRRLLGAAACAVAAGGVSAGALFSGAASAAAPAAPAKGGQLVLGMIGRHGSRETLIPARAGSGADVPRIWNLYDNLFRRGPDGDTVAFAVEAAESNLLANVWTLRLREGIRFHDGSAAGADDLLYTIRSWSDPAHLGHRSVAGLIDFANVRKRDARSVEIPLRISVAEFPSILTMVVYALVKNGSSLSDNSRANGSGPFKLGAIDPGKRTVLVANRDYWRNDGPHLDEVVLDSSFTDQDARLNALLSGRIHALLTMPFALARAHSKSNRITVLNAPGPSFQGFAMNLEQAPFKDVRVRQALRLLVDRERLVQSVVNGFGTVGNDLPANGTDFFASDFKRVQDLDRARFLLRQAGHTDLRIPFTVRRSDQTNIAAATVLKQQAKAAGVTIDIVQVDQAAYQDTYQYALGGTSWDSPLSSLSQFYLTTSTRDAIYPETRFGNAERDSVLLAAIAEVDRKKAADKWRAVQKLQFDQGGYIVYANANYVDAIGKNVRGLSGSRAGRLGGFAFADAWLA